MIKEGIRSEEEIFGDWNKSVLTVEKEFGFFVDKEYPVLKLIAQIEYLNELYSKQ